MPASPGKGIVLEGGPADVFFFNDTATTEIYTLSLHDALPISGGVGHRAAGAHRPGGGIRAGAAQAAAGEGAVGVLAEADRAAGGGGRRWRAVGHGGGAAAGEIGRASCRERV